MIGRIVASISGQYSISDGENIFSAVPRGIFRKDNHRLLVGDLVEFNKEMNTIEKILPRKNELKRPRIANIDQLLIVSSIDKPLFSFELVLKYLTFANFNHIHSEIIITKTDIASENEIIAQITDVFEKIGVKTHFISNKTGEGIEEIKKIFNGKVSALMGQSGVGKSSFLNMVDPLFDRGVGQYSEALGRGKHKTREVILLPFGGGFIADTPGFSSLELEMTKEELGQYFPGIENLYTGCAYSNCIHISEINCKVKEALNLGILPKVVYDCYIKMSNEALTFYRR